jgi:hypothetical protein
MKKLAMLSVCILALTGGAAFAQSQPAPGASSEGNVGPGATSNMPRAHDAKKGTTTGMGTSAREPSSSAPSSEGNVGPGTNNNQGKQPGGR